MGMKHILLLLLKGIVGKVRGVKFNVNGFIPPNMTCEKNSSPWECRGASDKN